VDPERKRAFKNALYAQFARIGKAFASPARIEIIELVAQGELTVDLIARETGLSVANASRHLQVLRQAQLVEVRRRGTFAYYTLAGDGVFPLWRAMREVGEKRLADIERLLDTYLERRDSLEPVTLDELRSRLKTGDTFLLDVRPAAEYRAGHIPGAVSIPLDELAGRIAEIPKRREVVAYCRGPYCVFADEAVALLRLEGRKARRLALGLPDWRAAGFRVIAGCGTTAKTKVRAY
jgi:rhodanese-related sulfurtransferase/DNA-binding transcriptional ArsR family regulator